MTGPPPAHNIRVTAPVRAALCALAERDAQTAANLMAATGYPSGTFYPVLNRLLDNGLADAEEEPSPVRGAPPRRVYTLTDAGRTHPTVEMHLREIGKTS